MYIITVINNIIAIKNVNNSNNIRNIIFKQKLLFKKFIY
jgi:hypothetical protein